MEDADHSAGKVGGVQEGGAEIKQAVNLLNVTNRSGKGMALAVPPSATNHAGLKPGFILRCDAALKGRSSTNAGQAAPSRPRQCFVAAPAELLPGAPWKSGSPSCHSKKENWSVSSAVC